MYKIKQAKDGSFFFTLQGRNGKVTFSSQMYTRKSSAKKGIVSVWYSNGGSPGAKWADHTTYKNIQDKVGGFVSELPTAS